MATWPGTPGRYIARPETAAERDRVVSRRSVGAPPSGSNKKPRTRTESVKHSVAKFFGIPDEDEAKRERRFRKWQASTRRMQNRSFVLSRRSTVRRTTPRPTMASRPTTASRAMTAMEYGMSDMSLRRAVLETPDSELLSSGAYDVTDSGLASASSQRTLPPHPLDPQAAPPTTEFTMQTLRPSRRMDRQARRAVTLKHDNVWKMAVDGMHTLSMRKPRPSVLPRARSINPASIRDADRKPVWLDISFFDEPVATSTVTRLRRLEAAAAVPRGDADEETGEDVTDMVPFIAKLKRTVSYRRTKKGLVVPERSRPERVERVVRRPCTGEVVQRRASYDEVDTDSRPVPTMTYIRQEFMEEFADNTNRHELGIGLMGRCLGLRRKEKIDADIQHQLDAIGTKTCRPFFTYWVTVVQITCFIMSVAVFGIARIGGAMTTVSGEVLTSSLSIEQVRYEEDSNFWVGPRQADLIHMGAKYSPCMRDDTNVREAIALDRNIERNSSCCVLNDGSGCVQTVEERCSQSLADWMKWSASSPGPDKQVSGSVCGQDPGYCINPSSVGAFVWPNDITQWPICEQTRNITSRNEKNRHMTCPIAGRPCCVGVQGHCVITTREYCEFRRGYFHDEAALCSQVACMDEICGMLPFRNPNIPDQVYRLWTSLFIHAGIVQLVISVIFQLLFMRDMEKLLGWLRICIIYIICGIAGSLSSAIFIPYHVEAGPSGSQFGILACFFIEIFTNWKLYDPSSLRWAVGWLSGVTIFLFVAGLLPMIDNYAHLIGFFFGLMLGFALMPYVTFGAHDKRGKLAAVIICLVLTVGLLTVLFIVFYVTSIYTCEGCQYFNCIPLTDSFCRSSEVKITRYEKGF